MEVEIVEVLVVEGEIVEVIVVEGEIVEVIVVEGGRLIRAQVRQSVRHDLVCI